MKFKIQLPKKSSDKSGKGGKKRFNIDLTKISPRGAAALLSFIIAVFLLGYFGYMKWQVKRIQQIIAEKEQVIVTKKQELNRLTRQESYQRYKATKLLVAKENGRDRKESTTYLIDIYNILQGLDDDTESNVVLRDFTVNRGTVNFQGSVGDISEIYREGGLLDQLISLEFIEHIDIPFYKKGQQGYSFVLDAKIKSHDTVEGAL